MNASRNCFLFSSLYSKRFCSSCLTLRRKNRPLIRRHLNSQSIGKPFLLSPSYSVVHLKSCRVRSFIESFTHNPLVSSVRSSFKRPGTTDSHSPELEIEGRVEGEPDDNRQTESGNAFEAADGTGRRGSDIIGEDIQTIIERGDMEQLAALVLNGEGTQLVGMEAKQPEIQAFLDNVPAYMVSKNLFWDVGEDRFIQ